MPWGAKYWSKAYVKDPTMAVRECLLHCGQGEALVSNSMSWLLQELEDHVADGLTFLQENPESAETNMMLLSAWNEHDEGHWIEPALEKYGGTEKLVAIKKAIDKAEARRKQYWAEV